MQSNGQIGNRAAADKGSPAGILHWPGRVLTCEDLRGTLNGQRELHVGTKTLVSPLVIDELKARRIKLVRASEAKESQRHAVKSPAGSWRFAQQHANGMVESVIGALAREGLVLSPFAVSESSKPARWARELARSVVAESQQLVVFAVDAGLVCCVANKIAGIRAAVVTSVTQSKRVAASLAPNFAAIDLPGPTFFEIKQMIRTLCTAQGVNAELAASLQELEATHAHR